MIKRVKSFRKIKKLVVEQLWNDEIEKLIPKESYLVDPNTIAYEIGDGLSLYKPKGDSAEIHLIMPTGVGKGFISQLKEQLTDLKSMGFKAVKAVNISDKRIAHLCRALGMEKLTNTEYEIQL